MSSAPRSFIAAVSVSTGCDCEHCGEPIPPGWTEFVLEAWHRADRCNHTICLRCVSAAIRRWTRESDSVSQRPA